MRNDRGSVTLWLVVFAFTVLVLLGFVVDGGQYMNGRERAADIAQQAARAAADDLQTGSLRNGHFIILSTACAPGGPAYTLVSNYAGNSARIMPGQEGCAIGGMVNGACQTPPPPGGSQGPCVRVEVEITVNPAIPIGPLGTLTTTATETANLDCGSDVKLTGVC
jgi:putative Flp pilus-assembly TadE/G-like protein